MKYDTIKPFKQITPTEIEIENGVELYHYLEFILLTRKSEI